MAELAQGNVLAEMAMLLIGEDDMDDGDASVGDARSDFSESENGGGEDLREESGVAKEAVGSRFSEFARSWGFSDGDESDSDDDDGGSDSGNLLAPDGDEDGYVPPRPTPRGRNSMSAQHGEGELRFANVVETENGSETSHPGLRRHRLVIESDSESESGGEDVGGVHEDDDDCPLPTRANRYAGFPTPPPGEQISLPPPARPSLTSAMKTARPSPAVGQGIKSRLARMGEAARGSRATDDDAAAEDRRRLSIFFAEEEGASAAASQGEDAPLGEPTPSGQMARKQRMARMARMARLAAKCQEGADEHEDGSGDGSDASFDYASLLDDCDLDYQSVEGEILLNLVCLYMKQGNHLAAVAEMARGSDAAIAAVLASSTTSQVAALDVTLTRASAIVELSEELTTDKPPVSRPRDKSRAPARSRHAYGLEEAGTVTISVAAELTAYLVVFLTYLSLGALDEWYCGERRFSRTRQGRVQVPSLAEAVGAANRVCDIALRQFPVPVLDSREEKLAERFASLELH